MQFANVQGEIDATDSVTISWSNMTESAILHYLIERSADGLSFQPTDTILPTQNSGGRADYHFSTHQTAEKVFYRIKAVEHNGTGLHSNILSLSRRTRTAINKELFTVYPNPITSGEFSFRLSNAPAGRYLFSLVAPGGQQMKQKQIEHNGGELRRQIDISGLPGGIYRIVLRTIDKKYTQQILYVN